MRILIIQPGHYCSKTGTLLKSKHKKGLCPSFILPYLAALFPKNAEITIIDETLQDINFDVRYDLVGITVKTPQAQRAYEIGSIFREKNIPVVMGGYHVNLCPEEAANYCDCVIIGEAESVWGEFMQDFMSGTLKKRYTADKRFDMRSMSFPRFDLMDFDLYKAFYGTKVPLETSRGCFNKCSYCCTPEVYKGGIVYRPVKEVIEDIKRVRTDLPRIKRPLFVFIDDNLTSDPQRCEELFTALKPLKVKWSGYFSAQICKRPDIIKLAAESGCYSAFLGLESINPLALKASHKEFNIKGEYAAYIRLFRENNIILILGMMLGFPEDGPAIFGETVRFLDQYGIPVAVIHPLYPFPKTEIYDRLKKEGMLYDETFWQRPHNPYALFKNNNLGMEKDSLESIFESTLTQVMSIRSIFQRTWPTRKYFLPLFAYNVALKIMLKKRGIWAFI